jgi:hypothetical protein
MSGRVDVLIIIVLFGGIIGFLVWWTPRTRDREVYSDTLQPSVAVPFKASADPEIARAAILGGVLLGFVLLALMCSRPGTTGRVGDTNGPGTWGAPRPGEDPVHQLERAAREKSDWCAHHPGHSLCP